MAELGSSFKRQLKNALDKTEKFKKDKIAKKRKQTKFNKITEKLTDDPVKAKYDLYKAIQKNKFYRSTSSYRDKSDAAREYIDNTIKGHKKSSIKPGMLLMFNYFEPKTDDQLEYFDAMPCTIFFGVVNTKNGKRVLGFNLHYYPPKLRYQILGWIYKTFKSDFEKTWDKESFGMISDFSYAKIMAALNQKDLAFGVRMYIPQLMAQVKQIYPKYFEIAVFTEGVFRKQTREAILKYWRGKIKKIF